MSTTEEMRARALVLADNFRAISGRVNTVAQAASQQVRLVAVSKYKPASDILALYNETGHRHFGENYVQELMEKAPELPKEIHWHFIGQLQSNKCRQLAKRIPNLWAVESLDSIKKATELEKGRASLLESSPEAEKLRVYVQVNTSGEEQKSGCQPEEARDICQHIINNCPTLVLQGMMTIGSIARSKDAENENEDFINLKRVRDSVSAEFGIELELSMGMTNDFEQAIQLGSTNVRVGTAIFGGRPPKEQVAVGAS
ncbi:hypothetical protein EX30DRAFT_345052 [Ascodesmis nigricans]|uniref:Pyridoxal phosphate homeostasis protein n=1 Tax=Ascodesmis nigricans TaxID=341454 RepID=A0A4S2MM54_9PEZI|nr:hypothetical protein EX30DRAFT_345052 [Ascodesmis nigricans]